MIWENHIDALLSMVTGSGITWLFSKKRQAAETEKLIHDNEQNVILMYRDALDDMEKRLKKQISELHDQLDLLKLELDECKRKAGFSS